MSEIRSISKYKMNTNVVIAERLFLKDDFLYVQSSDPVAGKEQFVFTESRELVGTISSSFYWELYKKMEPV